MEVRIEGADRLARTLGEAEAGLADFRTPAGIAARTAAARARSITPKQTGALAGSITAKASKRAGIIQAGGPTIRYARPVHWGAPAHSQQARPFLTRAAAETEPTWITAYTDHINNQLKKVKGK